MPEFMVIYEEESGNFFSSQHLEVLEVSSNSWLFLKQWFSLGVRVGCVSLFKGLLAIPGYIMSVTVWGVGVMCAAGVEKVEARYASDHPATHETAHSREVSAPNPAALSTEPRSREQEVPRLGREDE